MEAGDDVNENPDPPGPDDGTSTLFEVDVGDCVKEKLEPTGDGDGSDARCSVLLGDAVKENRFALVAPVGVGAVKEKSSDEASERLSALFELPFGEAVKEKPEETGAVVGFGAVRENVESPPSISEIVVAVFSESSASSHFIDKVNSDSRSTSEESE